MTPESTSVAVVQTAPDSIQQALAATQATADESTCALAETIQGEAEAAPARAPICPEGEKPHCTLGPPPVCHCE